MYKQLLLSFFLSAVIISCGGGNGALAPEITDVKPTSGPPGTSVTIFGKDFSPNISDNQVSFSGTVAPITSASESEIEATVPDGASSGTVTVSVDNKTANGSRRWAC